MTDRHHLIRYASCWAVALSFAMALPTTESKAQPLGPSLSQMQSQTQIPVYEKARAAGTEPRSARATRLAGRALGSSGN